MNIHVRVVQDDAIVEYFSFGNTFCCTVLYIAIYFRKHFPKVRFCVKEYIVPGQYWLGGMMKKGKEYLRI